MSRINEFFGCNLEASHSTMCWQKIPDCSRELFIHLVQYCVCELSQSFVYVLECSQYAAYIVCLSKGQILFENCRCHSWSRFVAPYLQNTCLNKGFWRAYKVKLILQCVFVLKWHYSDLFGTFKHFKALVKPWDFPVLSFKSSLKTPETFP